MNKKYLKVYGIESSFLQIRRLHLEALTGYLFEPGYLLTFLLHAGVLKHRIDNANVLLRLVLLLVLSKIIILKAFLRRFF